MEHLISLREPLKKAERSLFSSAKLGCANGFLCWSHFLGYILVTLLSTLSWYISFSWPRCLSEGSSFGLSRL